MRDRVVRHLLCDDILNPILKPYLIHNNGASQKGKGVSFIENKAKWHHSSLNEARYQKALKDLGEEVENG